MSPAAPFTERQQAQLQYRHALNARTVPALGSRDETVESLREARRQTLRAALLCIRLALEGPDQILFSEPSNDDLHVMLGTLEEALEGMPAPAPPAATPEQATVWFRR
ncbi:hypothetical protein SAMN05421678_108248 [Actinopolymorpha cephalotaxi]|uniref:Uncharacterized protein n=1 Tax=Actinopolymorpha cephalotaxi TaxID=504797 RepID=A0A1I2UU67_9ACTN|nr:hypothetical protein [Actinopolymorpha cephalotaxi]NYH86662.1 hypothetical protein [Actinopolymorpha cephalotaxi]SFG78486.1 hypothetical protein SAMN05421678_108248 [Actinopolymorpha cephalotaxi]